MKKLNCLQSRFYFFFLEMGQSSLSPNCWKTRDSRSAKNIVNMFSIRRILQRPNTCKVLPQLYNIRRAALTSHAAVQEPIVDMSPQTSSQTSKEAASPSYYKPLSKLDKFIPKEPSSKIVSIHNVPSTATKEDVLRLARLAFHDVDIPIQESEFKN